MYYFRALIDLQISEPQSCALNVEYWAVLPKWNRSKPIDHTVSVHLLSNDYKSERLIPGYTACDGGWSHRNRCCSRWWNLDRVLILCYFDIAHSSPINRRHSNKWTVQITAQYTMMEGHSEMLIFRRNPNKTMPEMSKYPDWISDFAMHRRYTYLDENDKETSHYHAEWVNHWNDIKPIISTSRFQ